MHCSTPRTRLVELFTRHVVERIGERGEEPVAFCLARKGVAARVVGHFDAGAEKVVFVEPVAERRVGLAANIGHALFVRTPRGPLGTNRQQGRVVGVVTRDAGDEDILLIATGHAIDTQSADENVASQAAKEDVAAVAA